MDFELNEEQALFRKTLHEWVEREVPKSMGRQWEADEFNYPEELWARMSRMGLHAIGIPEEYGGQGGDVITQVIVARELARSLGGLTWVWGIPSFCAKAVAAFATEAVRSELLPNLAEGKARMAISVTEPAGGTDLLGAMSTTAERAPGGWRLRGQKIWSSGAHAASHLLLLARSEARTTKAAHGVTAFLVPSPSTGLTIRQIPKVGMRGFGSCEIFLDNVFVPERFVVGEEGRGWYQMLTTLNNERILVAATCLGIIDGVLEDAVEYMKNRSAFGKTIGHFQSLQHYIADMAIWQQEAELLTYLAAWKQQRNEPCGVESNMAKIAASEYAGKAADLGIQILGGMGYAAETDMQRYWRDARLFRIGPLTNEMTRNMIGVRLGLPRSW
jgi:acyl-CoA dehydrogenase